MSKSKPVLTKTHTAKRPLKGLFTTRSKLLGKPRLDSRRAVFGLPFLQRFMIAALGFDDFTSVRILIDLYLARLAGTGLSHRSRCATSCLRVKQVDHIRQAITVFCEQSTQLRFELNFFLKASIAFQRFESFELLGEMLFKLAELCEFRHDQSLFNRCPTV